MATIDISRSHALGLDTAKQRAEQLANDLKDRMGIKWRWEGDKIRFSSESGPAKGTSGTLTVATSQVRIEFDLPFLLKAMKGTIAAKVEEKLDKLLG
ncbi:MAG: polyhydroxyalkanoic acid system family protein [Deltaproteobacteria bacterium]|nr:polyhydroxyalkanoic acid system family protein [Deltaproteobacteria bacterium]